MPLKALSGIKVNDEINQLSTTLSTNKAGIKYAIMGIVKDEGTGVDEVRIIAKVPRGKGDAERTNFISEIREQLDNTTPAWVVTELYYQVIDKDVPMDRSKVTLILWSPDDAPVKKKMIYASTHDAVKNVFDSKSKVFQVNDMDEIDLNELVKKIGGQ